jgi:hypothetical protein
MAMASSLTLCPQRNRRAVRHRHRAHAEISTRCSADSRTGGHRRRTYDGASGGIDATWGWAMSRIRRNLKVALLAGIAAGIAFAVVKLRHAQEVATQTARDIEAQIDALDPVTRAAVVAKLTADAARDVTAKRA